MSSCASDKLRDWPSPWPLEVAELALQELSAPQPPPSRAPGCSPVAGAPLPASEMPSAMPPACCWPLVASCDAEAHDELDDDADEVDDEPEEEEEEAETEVETDIGTGA